MIVFRWVRDHSNCIMHREALQRNRSPAHYMLTKVADVGFGKERTKR